MNKTKVKSPLRVFETFAGIGAQHKAISNIDKSQKYFKIVKTSEWDARAVIAYAQIHNKNKFEAKLRIIKKLKSKEINNYFKNETYSLDSKKPGLILRKSLEFKQNLMAAAMVNKNLPDINKVKGNELKNIDLLTYSFPCQGLSIANMGRDKGIKQNSNSTSNLIWQIRRILLEANDNNIQLPRYLLMENVKNLLSSKHKNDYKEWTLFLEKLGYVTKTIVLNAINHGSLQRRERVFGISILDWDDSKTNKEFEKWFIKKYKRKLNINKRQIKYIEILNSSDGMLDEIQDAIPNNTNSRKRMAKNNHDLFTRKWRSKDHHWTFNTLTTKQDRHPNIGMIKLPKTLSNKNKLKSRFITTREAYMIMGFSSDDFDNVKKKYKEKLLTKESLYRQAGNSIVISVLEDLFDFIKEVNNEY